MSSIYWTTENGSGTVAAVRTAGGIPWTLVAQRHFPRGIAVDVDDVYWTGPWSDGSVLQLPK